MFVHLLLSGFLGGQALPPVVDRGRITAAPQRIVAFKEVTATSAVSNGAPLGAESWLTHLDPSEERSYAVSFAELLEDGITIDRLDRISMSAAGRALGVRISTTSPPFVDEAGEMVQLRFSVIEAAQDNISFSGRGAQVDISFRVATTSDPVDLLERTALLTVRQQ